MYNLEKRRKTWISSNSCGSMKTNLSGEKEGQQKVIRDVQGKEPKE